MLNRNTVLFIISLLLISCNSVLFADTPYFMVNEKGYVFWYNVDNDSSGNSIVVWDDYRYTPGMVSLIGLENGAAIYIQKFDTDGNLMGTEKRIDRKNDLSISNTRPDIAINKNNGEITIVWQQRFDNSDGSRVSRIIFNIFDCDFHKKVFQMPLNNIDSIYQGIPEVIYLDNNNILITWFENDGRVQYYAKVLTPNGETVCNRFLVNSNTISASITGFGKTSLGFYCIWNSHLQFFDYSGNPISNIIETGLDKINSSKCLNDQELLLVYRNEEHSELNGTIYNLILDSFTQDFRIDDDTTGNKKNSSNIAVNNTGEFIIAWDDERNDYYSEGWGTGIYGVSDIYVQRYNIDKSPIGVNFKMNHEETERSQSRPKVSLINDHIICTYLQSEQVKEIDDLPLDAVDPSAFRGYIAGTSQNFYDPLPGRVFGWPYLFDLVFDVGYPCPNPYTNSSEHCSVDIEFNKETLVSYDIYNILGKLIYMDSPELLIEGEYSLTWNGKTKSGRTAPSGVYIWVIHLEDNIITRKSTLIK